MTPARRLKPAVGDPNPLAPADGAKPVNAGHIIEPMLSIDDLTRILSCSRRLVERMRAGGRLPEPDIRVGKMPRWKPSTIRTWIEREGNGR